MILERILPILSDREREIIQCTFIEGLSQKKLGNVLIKSNACITLTKNCNKKLQQVAKQ